MLPENQRAAASSGRLRGHIKAALLLFAFDGLYYAQGVTTVFVTLIMVVIGLVRIALGLVYGDRARLLHGVRVIAFYLALSGAVVGTICVNNLIAHKRADRIVAALRAYKGRNGHYPKRLADLVPEYLPSIPLAKYTIMGHAFEYSFDADKHTGVLEYLIIPPFSRRVYSLETETWRYTD
jgi:hypothetical protein